LAACKAYPLRPWEKLTFEYVLLDGVNDSDADARRVVKLLAHLNAKVNLIALNPGRDPLRHAASERWRVSKPRRRGLPCFVRKPRDWISTPPAGSSSATRNPPPGRACRRPRNACDPLPPRSSRLARCRAARKP